MKNLNKYKMAVALLFGVLGLVLSRLSIKVDDYYNLHIPWSLIFPILAALAYGTKGAFFALPSAFISFIISPERGWGNILTAFLYALWFLIHGYFAGRIDEKKYSRHKVYLVQIGYLIIFTIVYACLYQTFTLLNKPVPFGLDSVERFMAVSTMKMDIFNNIFTLSLILSVASIMLTIPHARFILGLGKREYADENLLIFSTACILSLLLFTLDGLLNRFFLMHMGSYTSIFAPNSGGILKICMLYFLVALVCDIAIGITEKYLRSVADTKKSEMRYKNIFDNIMDLYLEVDYSGEILLVSPSASKIFKYTAAYMNGKNIKDFCCDPNQLETVFETTIELGNTNNIEILFKRSDDTTAYLLLNAIHSVQEEKLLITASDISEYKASEMARIELAESLNAELESKVIERTRQLQNAYNELESFSYTVSHEFKTPIRAILAYMDMIEDDTAYAVKGIKKTCDETISMIDGVLRHAKASYSKMNYEMINMNALVESVCDELKVFMDDRKLKLNINKLPLVKADRFLIRQALYNIVSNSVKFSSSKPITEINVGCMHSDTIYTFYFADNGVGFDKKYSDKLFGLFNRMHTSEEFEGSGVGLATVRKIIERHGGEVYIEAKPGKGCVILFTIPIQL